jgi:hypothetical protein
LEATAPTESRSISPASSVGSALKEKSQEQFSRAQEKSAVQRAQVKSAASPF